MVTSLSEESWHELARKYWRGTAKSAPQVRDDVLKTEIWDPLERMGFDHSALSTLENLELLERYVIEDAAHPWS